MPRKREDVEREIKKLSGKMSKLKGELKNAKSRSMIKCNNCNKRTQVSKLVYLQTHWYEEPYSCTAGDRWHEGEGQFICSKCGVKNRLINRREKITDLKDYFSKVENVYEQREPYSFLREPEVFVI